MASAKKEMRTMLDNIDVIVEVRDARLPYTSANADLQTLGSHKRRLVVFNKSDLANSNLQNNITDTLQQQGLSSMFTSAKRGRRMAKIVDWCAEQSPSQFQTTGGIYCEHNLSHGDILIMGVYRYNDFGMRGSQCRKVFDYQ